MLNDNYLINITSAQFAPQAFQSCVPLCVCARARALVCVCVCDDNKKAKAYSSYYALGLILDILCLLFISTLYITHELKKICLGISTGNPNDEIPLSTCLESGP